MPYYRVETYTTTGTKGSWNLDGSIVPFNASVAITPNGGTANVTLQYSLNPLNNPTDTDTLANWVNSSLATALTTGTTVATFSNPIARIRVIIGTSAATTITVEAMQGLSTN